MTLVFDIDDTLLRERCYIAMFADALAAAYGADRKALARYPLKPYDAIEACIAPENRDEAIRLYRTGSFLAPSSEIHPSLPAMLFNGPFAIISDGFSQRQRSKLRWLGLEERASAILISEETGFEKISGKPFELMQELMPQEDNFVYVGDNPAKDFAAPNRLGWTTVMLRDRDGLNVHSQQPPTAAYAPTRIIDSLNQLLCF